MIESKLGLVTVLYNSDGVLNDFFYCISLQDYNNFVLYIVDNSTNENSTKLMWSLIDKHNLNDKIVYLPNTDNLGVAYGNNVGIKKAIEQNCNYLLLLNNDITFEQKNLFSDLIHFSISNNRLLVSPKILFEKTNNIWFAGCGFDNFKVKPIHYFYNEPSENLKLYDNECINGTTCFVLIDKQVFDKIGIMDEKYFVYVDDTDFFYRCNKNGIKNFFFSKYEIIHKVGFSSGDNLNNFSLYYSFRNRIYFILKHYNIFSFTISFIYLFIAFLLKNLKNNSLRSFYKSLKEGILLYYK